MRNLCASSKWSTGLFFVVTKLAHAYYGMGEKHQVSSIAFLFSILCIEDTLYRIRSIRKMFSCMLRHQLKVIVSPQLALIFSKYLCFNFANNNLKSVVSFLSNGCRKHRFSDILKIDDRIFVKNTSNYSSDTVLT